MIFLFRVNINIFLEFEQALMAFEDKCADGVMDFDELFFELETAKCQLEFVWASVNLMSFVTSKLSTDRFVK